MLNENEHQAQAQQEEKIQILVLVLMIVSRPFSREKWVAVLVFVASGNQAWVLLKSDITVQDCPRSKMVSHYSIEIKYD